MERPPATDAGFIGPGNLPIPAASRVAQGTPIGVKIYVLCKIVAAGLWLAQMPYAALCFFFAPVPWFVWQMLVPTSRGFGPLVTCFTPHGPEVWLTIDDGPDPETTAPVLDLLDAHGAQATFFVVGEKVARHPELVLEILKRGHSLGNHSHSHPLGGLWLATPGWLCREIDRCAAALQSAGAATTLFRPPVGLKSVFLNRRLAERGLHLVAWSARGYDSVANPATAVARIMKRVRPGAIILSHEGTPNRVDVIRRVLGELRAHGYRCVIPEPERFRG